MTTHTCPHCKISKTLETDFYKKKTRGKHGHHSCCKECMKAARRVTRTCFNCGVDYFHTGSAGAKRRVCASCYEKGRVCPGCETFKTWDRLYSQKGQKGQVYCRDGCASAHHRMRLYGVGREQYNSIVVATNNQCPACKRTDRKLVVDHDHATGDFRGLLCGPCNSGLGLFGDSREALLGAIAYLDSSPPGI